ETYLPCHETVIWREYHSLIEWLSGLEKNEDTFGLIHGDLGSTNFLCKDDSITLFDFDDSCYHWFLYDLAITFYPHGYKPCAMKLLEALLQGYAEPLSADDETIGKIVGVCRLRQLYLYLHYLRQWGRENLTEEQARW